MALEWEELDCRMLDAECYRAKVPGGWLVMIKSGFILSRVRGITFYPDPEHRWDGSSLGPYDK